MQVEEVRRQARIVPQTYTREVAYTGRTLAGGIDRRASFRQGLGMPGPRNRPGVIGL